MVLCRGTAPDGAFFGTAVLQSGYPLCERVARVFHKPHILDAHAVPALLPDAADRLAAVHEHAVEIPTRVADALARPAQALARLADGLPRMAQPVHKARLFLADAGVDLALRDLLRCLAIDPLRLLALPCQLREPVQIAPDRRGVVLGALLRALLRHLPETFLRSLLELRDEVQQLILRFALIDRIPDIRVACGVLVVGQFNPIDFTRWCNRNRVNQQRLPIRSVDSEIPSADDSFFCPLHTINVVIQRLFVLRLAVQEINNRYSTLQFSCSPILRPSILRNLSKSNRKPILRQLSSHSRVEISFIDRIVEHCFFSKLRLVKEKSSPRSLRIFSVCFPEMNTCVICLHVLFCRFKIHRFLFHIEVKSINIKQPSFFVHGLAVLEILLLRLRQLAPLTVLADGKLPLGILLQVLLPLWKCVALGILRSVNPISRIFPLDICPEVAYIISEVNVPHGPLRIGRRAPSEEHLASFFVQMQEPSICGCLHDVVGESTSIEAGYYFVGFNTLALQARFCV